MKLMHPLICAVLASLLSATAAAQATKNPHQPQPTSKKVDQNALLRANARSGLRDLEAWKKDQAAKRARGEAPCFSPTGQCSRDGAKKQP